ncbi:MAG: hypothetical protein ACYTDW_11910, partial [Planctomycetota bacterium]
MKTNKKSQDFSQLLQNTATKPIPKQKGLQQDRPFQSFALISYGYRRRNSSSLSPASSGSTSTFSINRSAFD